MNVGAYFLDTSALVKRNMRETVTAWVRASQVQRRTDGRRAMPVLDSPIADGHRFPTWARIPAGAVIGRNCRIDPSTTPEDYESIEVPSGATISKKA